MMISHDIHLYVFRTFGKHLTNFERRVHEAMMTKDLVNWNDDLLSAYAMLQEIKPDLNQPYTYKKLFT